MKKFNIFKVLLIVTLLTIVLSYFVPGTIMGYSGIEKGTIIPVTFADAFVNGITSVNASLTILSFVFAIGVFYAVLTKTERYETLVDNTAAAFDRNKALFVVITIFVLGAFSLFSGSFLPMLIFVPFLISVLRRLGYGKLTAIFAVVGSMLIGFSGSMYTYYLNQYLSLTTKDNITVKITLALIGLVSMVAFILLFNKKPINSGEVRKSTKKKMLPLYITFILIFVLTVLGFVSWNGYFGFTGFDDFLNTLRDGKVGGVSIFDAILGTSIVSFGNWQLYNSAILLLFISAILGLIYRIKFNDFLESLADGLKKSCPYALIVVLSYLVLVNVYSSGTFYTMVIGLTSKTVDLFNSSVSGILGSVFYADYGYATQFTLNAIMNTGASDYQNIFAITYQAIYSLFLLISPTSILVLFALFLTETRYFEWIKYIIKYFLILVIIDLLVIAIFMQGFSSNAIIFIIAIVVLLAFVIVLTKKNKVIEKKEVVKEDKKEETKEVKKVSTKKTTKKANKK